MNDMNLSIRSFARNMRALSLALTGAALAFAAAAQAPQAGASSA
jgi:hypothetical protein